MSAAILAFVKMLWGAALVRKLRDFILSIPIKTLLIVALVVLSYCKGRIDESHGWKVAKLKSDLALSQRDLRAARDEIGRDDADEDAQARSDEERGELLAKLALAAADNPNRGVCIRASFLRKFPRQD